MINEEVLGRLPRRLVIVTDDEGCRHLVPTCAIQLVSDADLFRDSVILVIAGRAIRIPRTLDHVLGVLTGREQ